MSLPEFKAHVLAFATVALGEWIDHAELQRGLETLELNRRSFDDTLNWSWNIPVKLQGRLGQSHVLFQIDGMELRSGVEWAAARAVGSVRVAIDLILARQPRLTFLEAAAHSSAMADENGRLRAKLDLAHKRIGELEMGLLESRLK